MGRETLHMPAEENVGRPGDVSSWYEEGELGTCPQCGKETLLPPDELAAPLRMCLTCGVLKESSKN